MFHQRLMVKHKVGQRTALGTFPGALASEDGLRRSVGGDEAE